MLEDFTVEKIPPLFPKIEQELMSTPEPNVTPQKEEKTKQKKSKEESIITIDKFFETSLKIGTILEAEEVPKSDRLLKLKVDLGEEQPRQVVAGIKEYYKPQELIDTQVCIVANLKPAKIMGLVSQGMLLAAKDENGLCLMRPQTPKKNGSSVG
jgi:methionyl-tRNA synthetase